ncbi:hypothetical protein ASJ81_11800 [Methanosarcina spelaei]|jgi:hypothetical protein|uniref:Uncharacterized protein n=1 Tax=Methanosarcina spelaei TaxID=1036679 RepID=A0A2A2HP98_9EURY|nr:hypothetical protein [Methanosarcina spelaei]PAV11064.1 hypothetical protein ASJ81_11800 [Methanosarcina spelaei]
MSNSGCDDYSICEIREEPDTNKKIEKHRLQKETTASVRNVSCNRRIRSLEELLGSFAVDIPTQSW